MVKKGDTLIEVTLAVGIFSMVAISVVAVMISGTSNSQTALETTLAREEIDTQAEALRFIHSAYLADEDTGKDTEPFTKLWERIINNAYNPNGTDNDKKYQQYTPSACQDIYNQGASGILGKAFVINPRALANLSTDNINSAYIAYTADDSKFKETLTYPRLIYSAEEENNTNSLVSNSTNTNLYRAEGLFVIAVADPYSTSVVGSGTGRASAFYDFYIRTCWYGAGSETPSTISTVIRLYNPKGIAE